MSIPPKDRNAATQPTHFGKYSKVIRELHDGNVALGNAFASMIDERDKKIADLVKALELIIEGAPETRPERDDYDFSNSGDVIDYGIELACFNSAEIARKALSALGGVE